MSFDGMGIERRHVQDAMDWTKSLSDCPGGRGPSRNTYVLCPVEHTLWDLKIVVDRALSGALAGTKPREWVTQTYEPDLNRLGFEIVKFAENKSRKLGVRGFDRNELSDPHTVLTIDGRREENGLAISAGVQPGIRLVSSSRFVRNSDFVKKIRSKAAGRCGCCRERTFKTELGEWFLEIHHKVWLSEGGVDEPCNMIALCPNCHRREHFGTDRRYGLSRDAENE